MKMKHWIVAALVSLFAGLAMANNGNGNGNGGDNGNGGGNGGGNGNGGGWGNVPEIDGELSIQMFALLAGVVYLVKRKK